MRRATLPLLWLGLQVLACGSTVDRDTTPAGSHEPTAASIATPTPTATATVEAKAEPEAERKLPEACEPGDMCSMPAEFGQRLCGGTHPEVALHLFAPKTPWKRAYLKRAFKAWHVGGRGELRELRAAEEVIVVTVAKPSATGMQIGGQAFDVLRWDGTCVSLMEDEITFQRPSNAVPANIALEELEPPYRTSFTEEKAIELARSAKKRTCEAAGADQEPGKSKCELARRHLSLTIAQSVGKGRALPPLTYVP
ncbi:MAG: hypothetical protein HOW73_22930 [Polyangiaceae bacterium]|nr:hypothetical protein [Polyangiaceae bacterium]